MSLFREINYYATAKNVNHFLTYWLPKLVMKSGRQLTDLSSPKLQQAPGHNSSYTTDTKIVDGMAAELVVQAIHNTIQGCPELSRVILTKLYLLHETPQAVINSLPYERAYFFKVLKPEALNCFADGYDYWQAELNIDDSDKRDLHAYMKTTE